MKQELEKAIKNAAEKASLAEKADDALKFTQAALNAAHALITIANMEK